MRRAKIVCALGPATDSYDRIKALVAAGMDVARFNLSHGSHAEREEGDRGRGQLRQQGPEPTRGGRLGPRPLRKGRGRPPLGAAHGLRRHRPFVRPVRPGHRGCPPHHGRGGPRAAGHRQGGEATGGRGHDNIADVHENVDIRDVVSTLELKEKCPGWDSNPHCMLFESIACCRLGYRGPINRRFTSTRCLSTIPQLGRLLGAVPLPCTKEPP